MIDSYLDKKNKLTDEFIKFFSNAKFEIHAPEPLIPKTDNTILFTNSAVATLKSYMREESLLYPGFCVCQPCLRTQGLSDIENQEYMMFFHMAGAFCTSRYYDNFVENIYEWFTKIISIDPKDIVFHMSNDHNDLAEPWNNYDIKILNNQRPQEEYEWSFGVENVYGHGITFAFRQHDNSFKDVGNIMAFYLNDKILAYGLGFGIETIMSRIESCRFPLNMSIIGNIISFTNDNKEMRVYADLLQSAIVMFRIGISPGKNGKRHVLRSILKSLVSIINDLKIDIDTVLLHASKFELLEFISGNYATCALENFLKSKKIKETTNIINQDISIVVNKPINIESIENKISFFLGDDIKNLKSIECISVTDFEELPISAKKRLGIHENQVNLLIRLSFTGIKKEQAKIFSEYIFKLVNQK